MTEFFFLARVSSLGWIDWGLGGINRLVY